VTEHRDAPASRPQAIDAAEPAEQDAKAEAQDYQQNFADGDPDDYWTAIYRHMSIGLDKRAERIRQKMRRRAGADVNEPR
jgi:hypothetical protein